MFRKTAFIAFLIIALFLLLYLYKEELGDLPLHKLATAFEKEKKFSYSQEEIERVEQILTQPFSYLFY